MYQIEAVIKPQKLNDVADALNKIGIIGLTAVEVNGYGRQKGVTEMYRGSEYKVKFVPKVLIKVAVKSVDLEKALETIRANATTGNIGDGKIFVFKLESVMRIRTAETGEMAI